jgi:hypothetical protein
MLGAWNGWADEIGVKKVTESGGKQKTE